MHMLTTELICKMENSKWQKQMIVCPEPADPDETIYGHFILMRSHQLQADHYRKRLIWSMKKEDADDKRKQSCVIIGVSRAVCVADLLPKCPLKLDCGLSCCCCAKNNQYLMLCHEVQVVSASNKKHSNCQKTYFFNYYYENVMKAFILSNPAVMHT